MTPNKKRWKSDHEHLQPSSKMSVFRFREKKQIVLSLEWLLLFPLNFAPFQLINLLSHGDRWVVVLEEVGEVSLLLKYSLPSVFSLDALAVW